MELNPNHVEAILFGAARPVKLSEMKSIVITKPIDLRRQMTWHHNLNI